MTAQTKFTRLPTPSTTCPRRCTVGARGMSLAFGPAWRATVIASRKVGRITRRCSTEYLGRSRHARTDRRAAPNPFPRIGWTIDRAWWRGPTIMCITEHGSNAESIRSQPVLWFIMVYAVGFLTCSAFLDLWSLFETVHI